MGDLGFWALAQEDPDHLALVTPEGDEILALGYHFGGDLGAVIDERYVAGVDDGRGALDIRGQAGILECFGVGLRQGDRPRGARPRAAAKAAA